MLCALFMLVVVCVVFVLRALFAMVSCALIVLIDLCDAGVVLS